MSTYRWPYNVLNYVLIKHGSYKLNQELIIRTFSIRMLGSSLLTLIRYMFLGSFVKLVQPAWHGERYSMLLSPHTGLKPLFGHEQLGLQYKKL